jgi:hypothetical protein
MDMLKKQFYILNNLFLDKDFDDLADMYLRYTLIANGRLIYVIYF